MPYAPLKKRNFTMPTRTYSIYVEESTVKRES